jgi:hypothetical protein
MLHALDEADAAVRTGLQKIELLPRRFSDIRTARSRRLSDDRKCELSSAWAEFLRKAWPTDPLRRRMSHAGRFAISLQDTISRCHGEDTGSLALIDYHSAGTSQFAARRGLEPMMQTYVKVVVAWALFSIALMSDACAVNNLARGWDPNAFRDQSTLQIMTIGPEEGEHWSRLWLVVIDGQLYIRLGDRAFARVQKNTANPYVGVKIGDKEFDKVRLEAAPDMTDKVAAAMADKYFMDILIRHESHPMTARLIAEPMPASAQ